MRPDRIPENSVPTTGPEGLVPEAYHRARRLHLEGRTREALQSLEEILGPDGKTPRSGAGEAVSMRDAALLKGWCLIELKRHKLCKQWLESARGHGFLQQDDPAVMILELNIQIFEEHYEIVQDMALSLLSDAPRTADLNTAELRLLLGAALRWQGDMKEAVPHLEFACSAFLILGEPGREAVAANFLGWTHLSMGHLEEGRRWFEKSLQINTGLGATLRMAQNCQNLSIVAYKQGRYPAALELLERELGLTDVTPDMVCRARIAEGNIKRLLGDFLGARPALMEGYSLAAENGLAREEALALEFLGDVLRDEGNPAEARRYYQRGQTVARALAPRGDLVMELLRREGECLDLEGRHEEALHVLNDALALCREVGDRFETAVTYRCLGVNAANLGRWKAAGEHLQNALDGLRDLSARHEMMIAEYLKARTLVRRIDSGNAGGASGRLLEQAWRSALAGQQLNQELDVNYLRLDIQETVADLARRRVDRRETSSSRPTFSLRAAPSTRVIAVSSAMQHVLRTCDGFARYDTPVLIHGEPGTGKELLAHRLHEAGPRGSRPLVKVVCTPTAEEVLAREIFGQVRTTKGGLDDVPGLVAQAEGGTLLLSGVDNLPRSLQARIMELLQNGTFRRIGDSRERRADLRIIATCNRDPKTAVETGRFRPDLHFKLTLMKTEVPPLRERSEDVLPLLDHFLTRHEGSTLTARSLFDFQALDDLVQHHWPGNVAELESIAQRAWLNRDLGQSLQLRRIKGKGGSHELEFFFPDRPQGQGSATVDSPPTGGMTWSSLNSLIDRAGGNKSHVARNLGISRVTLYRWLDRLDPNN